ncbi:MAG: hypothetical protein J6A29_00415 [Clostridia bacterium]|nr:hypothetical protein [Clostridia bacterium]
MKKIGFIGAYDKTDLILYVAKVLVEANKKVIVVDTTITQKARYIVPCIAPSKYYITEYEGIDVAVGFNSLNEIKQYSGVDELKYDFALVDIDNNENFNEFEMVKANKNYFVTGFDSYSLKKGLEVIGKKDDKLLMEKVLFSQEMLDEEDDYLNFLSFYYSVRWENKKIYFPYENGDNTAIIENQRTARIRFKNLSDSYKEGLYSIAQDIMPDIKNSEIKKIIFKRGE